MSQSAHSDDAPAPPQTPLDNATLSMRLMLVQDQLRMAAEKVNLLAGMGLSHTEGYKSAFEAYEVKLVDFNALKDALGM